MESSSQWAGHESESALGANAHAREGGDGSRIGQKGTWGCGAVPEKLSAGSQGPLELGYPAELSRASAGGTGL